VTVVTVDIGISRIATFDYPPSHSGSIRLRQSNCALKADDLSTRACYLKSSKNSVGLRMERESRRESGAPRKDGGRILIPFRESLSLVVILTLRIRRIGTRCKRSR